MRFLKLTIAYDGTDYVGWQVQPNGDSIQSKLENAWTEVTRESTRIVASGRTDAGVHALGQVCSIATHTDLNNNTLCRALNANLPVDIMVISVESAPQDFHAIADAKTKLYRYQIQSGWPWDLFQRKYRWRIKQNLDLDSMRQAAQFLIGEHDFVSFQASGATTKTTVRTVSRLDIFNQSVTHDLSSKNPFTDSGQGGGQQITIEIESNGFLYNMVRNISGTLVQIGSGKKQPAWISEVLIAKDRCAAGPTAPPEGLFLVKVDY